MILLLSRGMANLMFPKFPDSSAILIAFCLPRIIIHALLVAASC